MRGLLATLSAVAALAVPAVAAAAAETFTFTQHVQMDGATANPCLGKPGGSAFFEGFFTQALHISTDAEGGTHVANHIVTHMTASTDSGTRHVFATGATHFAENTTGGASEFTFVTPIHFITTGPDTPDDDLNFQAVNHVTVNANGEVTSSTFELRSDCQ